MASGEVKRQMGVALPDDLREQLQEAADAAGHSVAAEIRLRLEQSFRNDGIDQSTRDLMAAMNEFAALVKLQTNQLWHDHAAAGRVFRGMVLSRLARLGMVLDSQAVFQPGELPAALLVNTENVNEMATALEAIQYFRRPLSDQEMREVKKKTGDVGRAVPPGLKGRPLSEIMAAMEKIEKEQEDKS